MSMELVARVDIRDVHFEDRTLEGLQCVEHRDRCERVPGGIDDNRVGLLARRLNEIDQHSFMVRLMKRQLRAREPCKFLAACLDRSKGGGPIDVRLAHAEEVEVRPVQDHQSHLWSFPQRRGPPRYHALTRRGVWQDCCTQQPANTAERLFCNAMVPSSLGWLCKRPPSTSLNADERFRLSPCRTTGVRRRAPCRHAG